jgi:vacuolar-type H+-ATPase catalytic subunit A/Vma1
MYEERCRELRTRSEPLKIETFRTSIWDETLYAVSLFNGGVGGESSYGANTLNKYEAFGSRKLLVLTQFPPNRRGLQLYML